MNIDCEYCGATAGEKCTTATGNTAKAPHKARQTKSGWHSGNLKAAADGELEPRYIEVDTLETVPGAVVINVDEYGDANLQFAEPLRFHVERMKDLGEHDKLELLATDLGYTRLQFANALVAELKRQCSPEFDPLRNLSVDWGTDEEHLEDDILQLDIFLGGRADRFTDEELTERVWPLVVSLLNITDPGTFGARYVFG